MKKKLGSLGVALASLSLLLPAGPARTVHAQAGADFTRFVVVGDSLAAGFQDGSLYDGQTRPASLGGPYNGGQRNGYVALLGTSMGTQVVLPLMTFPGPPPSGVLIQKPDHCPFLGSDQPPPFDVVPPANPPVGREDPTAVATDVAVPGQTIGDALTKKWDINPADPSTIDTIEDLILGLPYAFQPGATSHTQIETAVGLQPTFVIIALGGQDALGF